jgi:hypothetical protein
MKHPANYQNQTATAKGDTAWRSKVKGIKRGTYTKEKGVTYGRPVKRQRVIRITETKNA